MGSPAQDTETEQDAVQAKILVLLPDMFVSFLSRKPQINPHYEKVREESEDWINRFLLSCYGFDGH